MPTFRNTLFHLHRQVDVSRMNQDKKWNGKRFGSSQNSRRRVITQKKAYNIYHIMYCNLKVNFFLCLINHYVIVTYGRVVVQLSASLTPNLDKSCEIKLTYVQSQQVNSSGTGGFSSLLKAVISLSKKCIICFRVDCTQRTMETDRKASPASECDKPLLTQQESEQLTRPFVAQVSITYRSAAKQ